MGEYKITPANEMQTREWLAAHLDDFGIDILKSQTAFPDCVISRGGKVLNVEIEYASENFIAHDHNPAECDFVICWIHTANLPLPVLELSTGKEYNQNAGAEDAPRKVKIRAAAGRQDLSWVDSCHKEIRAFADCMIKDVHAYNGYILAAIPVRHELTAVQKRLEDAIRQNGGEKFINSLGRLHPYDFNKALADVIMPVKVVIGIGRDDE